MQATGHTVAICTAEGFRSLIEAYGVTYAHMNNELLALIQAQEGQAAVEGSGDLLALLRKGSVTTFKQTFEVRNAVRRRLS